MTTKKTKETKETPAPALDPTAGAGADGVNRAVLADTGDEYSDLFASLYGDADTLGSVQSGGRTRTVFPRVYDALVKAGTEGLSKKALADILGVDPRSFAVHQIVSFVRELVPHPTDPARTVARFLPLPGVRTQAEEGLLEGKAVAQDKKGNYVVVPEFVFIPRALRHFADLLCNGAKTETDETAKRAMIARGNALRILASKKENADK